MRVKRLLLTGWPGCPPPGLLELAPVAWAGKRSPRSAGTVWLSLASASIAGTAVGRT